MAEDAFRDSVRRLHVGAIVGVVALIIVGSVAALGVLADGQVRHTRSVTTTLVNVHESSGDSWILVTERRDIWIRADGSGRIQETHDPVDFPTSAEREEWMAGGRIAPRAVNETFEPGGLLFVPAEDLRMAPATFDQADRPAGEVLGRIASLLTETVPPSDVVDAVIAAAERESGITVDRSGDLVIMSAPADGTPDLIHVLTFDLRARRLTRVQQVVTESLPGLDLAPPIVRLDRWIEVSELLPWWELG